MGSFFREFKYNIFLAIVINLIFISIEQFYRIFNDILIFNLTFKSFFDQLIIHLIIVSIANRRAIFIIYSILLLFVWFQLVHFSFYGTWIFPLEFMLFFTEFNEVIGTFKSVLHIVIFPTILVIFAIISIFILISKFKKRKPIPYFLPLFILLLVYTPIELYMKNQPYRHSKPNFEYNPIKNTIFALGNLTGVILPKKLFANSGLEQDVVKTPSIIDDKDINIVIIMGESLHKDFMSLYDYSYETTPFLNNLKNDANFYYQNAISSSVFTMVSLGSFFNMLQKPDGTPQILSRNSCLFKMAKENNFKTYFYSAQSSSSLKGIKSYICPTSIDFLADGSSVTNEANKNPYDSFLVDKLDEIDFSQKSFVVLHQRSSHSPFYENYPKEHEYFSKDLLKDTSLNQTSIDYMNAIRYTDFIIESIINKIKSKTSKPTYILFTSDHATNIENKSFIHGNLNFKEIYQVPFFIYTLNTKNDLKNSFGDFPYISHYQISNIVSKLLGYETNYNIFNKKEDFWVLGNDISGLAGYLKIVFDEENNQIRVENK